jgi:hypothetical protein
MPILNAAATLARADDLAATFAAGQVIIKEGGSTLATHTIASWSTSNSGNDATAEATINDVNASATGTGDTVVLKAGAIEYDITDSVTISQPEYIQGQNATVPSLSLSFNSIIGV